MRSWYMSGLLIVCSCSLDATPLPDRAHKQSPTEWTPAPTPGASMGGASASAVPSGLTRRDAGSDPGPEKPQTSSSAPAANTAATMMPAAASPPSAGRSAATDSPTHNPVQNGAGSGAGESAAPDDAPDPAQPTTAITTGSAPPANQAQTPPTEPRDMQDSEEQRTPAQAGPSDNGKGSSEEQEKEAPAPEQPEMTLPTKGGAPPANQPQTPPAAPRDTQDSEEQKTPKQMDPPGHSKGDGESKEQEESEHGANKNAPESPQEEKQSGKDKKEKSPK